MLSPWALEPGNPETYPIYMANNTMPSLVTKSVSRDTQVPQSVLLSLHICWFHNQGFNQPGRDCKYSTFYNLQLVQSMDVLIEQLIRTANFIIQLTFAKQGFEWCEFTYKWIFFQNIYYYVSVQFSSVAQPCPTLCDPMNHSTPGLPVHHQLPEFTQTHVHRVSDAIQPSHPLSSPSPPTPNPSQHQGLFQWVISSHEVAKVLEFQLQHQSFQWTLRTDLL